MEPTKQCSNLLEAAMRECGLIVEQAEEETGSAAAAAAAAAAVNMSLPSITNQNSSLQNPSTHVNSVIPSSMQQRPSMQSPRNSIVVYQTHPDGSIRNPSSLGTHPVAVERSVTNSVQNENSLRGNLLFGLNNINQVGGRQARIVSVSRMPSLANAPGLKRIVPITVGSPVIGPANPSSGKSVTLISGMGTQIVTLPHAGTTGIPTVTGGKPEILSSPIQTFQQFQTNVGPLKTQVTAVRVPMFGTSMNKVSIQPQFSVRKTQPVQLSVSTPNRVQVPSYLGPSGVQRIPTVTGNVGVLSQILRPSSPAGPSVIRLTPNVSSSSSLFVQPANQARSSAIGLTPNVSSSSSLFVQPALVTCVGVRQPAPLLTESASSVPATLAGKRIIRLAPLPGTSSSQTVVQSVDNKSVISSANSGGLSLANANTSILKQSSFQDHSSGFNFKANSSPNLTTATSSFKITATSSEKNTVQSTDATVSGNGMPDSSVATSDEQMDSSPPVTFQLSDEEDEDDPNDFMAALRQLRENNKKAEEVEATRRAKQSSETAASSSPFSGVPAVTVSDSDASVISSKYMQQGSMAEQLQMKSNPSPRPAPSLPSQMFSLLGSQQRLASGVQTTAFSNLGTLGLRNVTILNASSKSVYSGEASSRLPTAAGASSLQLCAPNLPAGSRAFTNQVSLPSISSSPGLSAFLVDKVSGKVWVNDSTTQAKFVPQGMFLPMNMAQQPGGYLDASAVEPEVEEEELGHAETYADYKPAKLSIGRGHPDPAVESSSLSSVEPPDIEYVLNLPEEVILEGRLSSLQLETITYACQKHETFLPNKQRVGYLIGDGAGVGKGRTIAGIIFENVRCGRKRALWLSVSNDLLEDARRDLNDVGAYDIELHALNKFKYAKISSKINQKVKRGVLFSTYSSLIGESQKPGKYSTRMKQVLRWLGKEFEGVIIFDECHRAKNLIPNGSSKATKTGLKVVELQDTLPNARIVYASATGASEPKNMAYMVRLGLWGPATPFKDFGEFHSAIKKRGVGAMELVAMEMKQRGTYIARQLSFQGVSFKIVEVGITDKFIKLYNECVRLWVKTREYFHEALELLNNDQARYNKTAWGQYWSTHQRFFKYLCISSKVPYVAELSLEAVRLGKSVVIGLQSTGEAKTLEQLESYGGELTEFLSTAKGVFQKLIENHFPNPDSSETWSEIDEMSSQTLDSREEKGKRKMATVHQPNSKRLKLDADFSDGDSRKSSESDSTDEDEIECAEASEVEFDEEEDAEDVEKDWESESDDDDTNPFAKASGSEDDSDPWIRKPKKRFRGLEPKKAEKKTDRKMEKKAKKKRSKQNSSDDEFGDDFEEQAAKAVTFLSQKETTGSQVKNMSHKSFPSSMSTRDKIVAMKQELLADIEELGPRLPSNTLDELIEKLGGKNAVAEMTGRKGRLVMTASGIIQYESRGEVDATLENINNTERQRFMEGEKRIAIISEAASSGISLHADRRAGNQTRRVHITLELPWSADRAIQQFGRTHRSNQRESPEYIFLISELAGERRFAATVAKRLESLGALTHGDRRATETRDLSQFNIDNRYGQQALSNVIKSVLDEEKPLVDLPCDYKGDFRKDVKKALAGVGMGGDFNTSGREKDQNQISKFLNRILGMEVAVQNTLFQYFTSTLEEIIMIARREGTWDLGILDIGSSGEHVLEKETKEFSGLFSGFQTKIRLTTVIVERGVNWSLAVKMLDDNRGEGNGFYSNKVGCRLLHILAVGTKTNRGIMYKIYKPNMGITSTLLTAEDLKSKYTKVTERETAKRHWDEQYEASANLCQHQYQFNHCRSRNCETGKRTRLYHILSGSVLSVWTSVEKVLKDVCPSNAARMQVIRVRTTTGKRIVGTLIPAPAVEPLSKFFKDSELPKSKPQVRTTSTSNLTSLISNSSSMAAGDIYRRVEQLEKAPILSMPNFL